MGSIEAPNTLTDEQSKWSVYTKTRSTIDEQPLSKDELDKLTRYFHATLYLCLGMLYLKDNPLLQEPLKKEHLKAHAGLNPNALDAFAGSENCDGRITSVD